MNTNIAKTDMANKTCSLCGINKSIRAFDKSPKTGRIYPRCKQCRKEKPVSNETLKRENSKRWCVNCNRHFYPQAIYQKCCSVLCDNVWEKTRFLYAQKPVEQIYVKDGVCAFVDREDYEYLIQYQWHLINCDGVSYAYTSIRFNKIIENIAMHNFIMQTPSNYICDHRNHDGLDNRKQNLRVCTYQQNQHNRRLRIGTSSKYKGVCKHENKWQAQIRCGSKTKYLGHYDSETEAALAYDRAAIETFGEFAYLNFPKELIKAS